MIRDFMNFPQFQSGENHTYYMPQLNYQWKIHLTVMK